MVFRKAWSIARASTADAKLFSLPRRSRPGFALRRSTNNNAVFATTRVDAPNARVANEVRDLARGPAKVAKRGSGSGNRCGHVLMLLRQRWPARKFRGNAGDPF